ncbi:MAG: DUF4347 domain-containing protein [Pseudomonadota bacterium]
MPRDASRTEIIFIDTSVAGYERLLADVPDSAETVLLDPHRGGLDQMADYLSDRAGIDAIHLISHGEQAALHLGADRIDRSNLPEHRAQFETIGRALSEEGDLLLYGCDVTGTAEGEAFVQDIARLTGADVAASDDPTGTAARGGDWSLETTVGHIEAPLDVAQFLAWDGLLALPITSNQTTNYNSLGFSDTQPIPNGTVIDDLTYNGWRFNGFGGETGVYPNVLAITPSATTATRIFTADGSEFAFTEVDYIVDTFGSPAIASYTFFGYRDGVQIEDQTFNAGDGTSGTWTLNWGSVDEIRVAGNTNFVFFDNLVVGAVIPVNTAPEVDLNGGAAGQDTSAAFSEGSGPVALAPAAVVTEPDADLITSITVALTNDQDGVNEGLSVSGAAQDALVGVSGATDITRQDTIQISGVSATAAEVQAFLRAITYDNGADAPTETARTVTVVINDGAENSVSRTSTISVTDVTAASSSLSGFDTSSGANLTPGIVFGAGDETLTIANSGHTVGSTAAGGTGTDTLVAVDGVNLANLTTLSGFEALTVQANAVVSMSSAQHNAFATFTNAAAQTIGLAAGSDAVTGNANIESYSLGAAYTGAFTLGAAGQNVTGADGAQDSVDIATLATTGTLSGGTGADMLIMGNGSSISGATVSGFTALTVSDNASVTMTEAQHDAFGAANISGNATEQIVISAATDGFTTSSVIETYVLGVANSVSLGAAAGNLAQNVTGSSANDTVALGAGAYTGTLNAGGGTGDTLALVDGSNASGASVSNFENLTIANDATVTLGAAQLAQFTGTVTAAGTETVDVTGNGDFTTLANVETINVTGDEADNQRTITLAQAGVDVAATAVTDAVTFDIGALSYTGAIFGDGTVDDTLRVGNGGDVSGATLSNIEILSLDSNATITISAAQYAAIQSQAIAAAGTEAINIVGDGTVTLSGDTVESYAFGDASSDTRTVAIDGANSATITANAASDAVTFNITGGNDFTGSFTADASVANTLNVSATGTQIQSATLSGFSNLTLAGTLTLTSDQANAFTGTIVAAGGSDTLALSETGMLTGTNLSAIEGFATVAGGAEIITLSASAADGRVLTAVDTGSDGFVVTGAAGAQDITGSAGSDALDGGAGQDSLGAGAGADTLTGGTGDDTFRGTLSELDGDTITDLAAGDRIVLTGVNLTDANVRFTGSNDALEVDGDATTFAAVETTLNLSNTPGASLVASVSNDTAGTSTIVFSAANTMPVLSGLGGSVGYTENAAGVVLDSDVTVADAELDALNASAGNYDGASLTLERTGGVDAADIFGSSGQLAALTEGQDLTFNGTAVGTVTTNSGGTLVLSFNAAATTALVNSVLQSLTYANGSDTPGTSASIDWVFSDGALDSAVGTTTISITEENDAPVVAGTPPSPTIDDTATATPFSGLSLTDAEGEGGTVAISYAGANGTLNGVGLSGAAGSYTLSGASPAELTTRLQALTFQPTENQAAPGATTQTAFNLTANDGTEDGAAFTLAKVTVTSVNDAPVIGGLTSGLMVDDTATVSPFSSAVLSDPDPGQTVEIRVTLDDANKGAFTAASLSATGFADAGTGTYTLSGATIAAAQAALRGLSFAPSEDRVLPGEAETTTLTVSVDDGVAAPTVDGTVTVVSRAVNDAPEISGTAAGQAIADTETLQPFATVSIADADTGQTLRANVKIDDAAKGGFTAASLTASGFAADGAGAWLRTGTPEEIEAGLQALVFEPTGDRTAPGTSETATLTLDVGDSIDTTTDDATSVVVTSVNDPAQIGGALTGRLSEDANPNQVRGTLTATDPDGTDNAFRAVESATATAGGRGTYTLTAAGEWTFTLDTAAAQALRAGAVVQETFSVITADGTEGTVTISIDGANDAPRFSAPGPERVEVDGRTVTLGLFDGARDPDGDALTVSDLVVTSDRRGDVAFTLTGSGQLLIQTDQFRDLARGQEERLALSYILSDGSLATEANREVVLTGANRAPIAEDDRFFLAETSEALLGNVLSQNGGARDRDPDGEAIRIVALDGTPVPGDDAVTVVLPSGDTVTLRADGEFSVDTRGANESGAREVSFGYTIADAGGARDTARVLIEVSPSPTDEAGRSWQFGPDALIDDPTIRDFAPGNSVVIDLPTGNTGNVAVSETETGFVLSVDNDDDGEPDGTIVVEATEGGGGFLVSELGDGASGRLVLDYVGASPGVSEGQALAEEAVNGIANTAYLTGNGERGAVLTFQESTAALDNAIGTYVVAPDGSIGDVQVIFANTNATAAGTRVALDPLDAGEFLGVFLISGGAALEETSTLRFESGTGSANAFADIPPVLLIDDREVENDVFHAFSGLNENGNRMVWSGYDSASGGLTLGFEDLALPASDRDYNDVLIGIEFI